MLEQLRFLAPTLRPYRRSLFIGLAAILVSVGIGMLAPLLIGSAVDTLRVDVSTRTLMTYGLLLVVIAAVQGLFSYLQRMTLVTMSRDVELDLRDAYFARLSELPLSFYQRQTTGDLMARGTNDLGAVRMLCGPAIMYSANTVITASVALVFMVRIDLGLTLLALVAMPAVVYVTHLFGRRIHQSFERVQAGFSDLSTEVQENLAGARVLRAYAQEAPAVEGFRRANQEYVTRNERLIRWTAAFHPTLAALIGLGFVAVLWYGGLLVTRGAVTVGEFVTFHLFLAKLIWPMIAIGWVINLAQRGTASLGRLREVLEMVPSIADSEPLPPSPPVQGAIAFRDLGFTYPTPDAEGPGPRVLDGVDLEVPVGTVVALVGRTGAGKSTLLSLIPRLIDPPPGTLYIDGVEAHRLPLAALRGAVGMVPQESFLFSTTVGENIAVGDPDAPREAIAAAAREAGLGADLEGFPDGLDTVVGERGITLSGGQKQRVALARAILRRPRILLLDDALSSVDTHTEEEILGSLRRVFEGRTVFLVSHRVSTVRDADLIVVLDEGRIVERGRHHELVAHGGLYADLARRQRLEEELAAV